MNIKGRILVPVVFFIIGVLFTIVGVVSLNSYNEMKEHGVSSIATITDVSTKTAREKRNGKWETVTKYDVIMEYMTGDKKQNIKFTSEVPYKAGELKDILYLPHKPTSYMMGSVDSLGNKIFPFIFLGIGVGMLIAFAFIMSRKIMQR